MTPAPVTPPELPAEAHAAAIAGLAGIGPARLGALLAVSPPRELWERLLRGAGAFGDLPAAARLPAEVASVARRHARSVDVGALWRAHQLAGIEVRVLGTPGYPDALAADHEAPGVLFYRGDLGALDGPRVAIVGTRRCTHAGRDIARELGRDLSSLGVRVVSGLALGIDGAAHRGALEAAAAPPIAVVGSGLDVVYPARHAALWSAVAEAGVLLGEAPVGTRPEPWRFPLRNRILAALADVVVVVESHVRGGSRYTVDAAVERGRRVMAVPGSVRNSAAAYTNGLLADGFPPARDALDVVTALGLSSAEHPGTALDRRPVPEGGDASVLDAIGWETAGLEEIVLRSGRDPTATSVSLARLETLGWIESGGGWWRRVGPP